MHKIASLAHAFNFYSLTLIIIFAALIGRSEFATDLSLIQGASMAVFFAFSANARSLILSNEEMFKAVYFFKKRLVLTAPLSICAFVLCVYISSISGELTLLILIRKSSEWFNEIFISELERKGVSNGLQGYLILDLILLMVVFWCLATNEQNLFISLLFWSCAPLILMSSFLKSHHVGAEQLHYAQMKQIMTHIGSTMVIGVSVYIFRNLVVFYTNKTIAGDILAAIAIGGMLANIFSNSFGASIVKYQIANNVKTTPVLLRIIEIIVVTLGCIILVVSARMNVDMVLGKSMFFWNVLGMSLIGSVVMLYAVKIRMYLIQSGGNRNVLYPDLYTNLFVLLQVPIIYKYCGISGFASLYLNSAVIMYLIYKTYFEKKTNI